MPAPTPTDDAQRTTDNVPSHPIPPAQYWFTKLIQIPLMAAATAFFGSVSLICGLWDRSGRRQHLVARTWARVMLRCTLSPVEIVGAENLPGNKNSQGAPSVGGPARGDANGWEENSPAVYASNHLSYMDTPVLFARLPFQFRILAKQGLWKVPFVGWYLAHSGQVPIDSSSPRSAVAGLLRGVAALRSGMPLVVFPEGSRTPHGGLQPMASGAAFMAIRAGVPLVPVALVGTYELLPIHVYALRPRPLKIVIGTPLPTDGLTTRDADALTARLYSAIERMYYAHSK
jgi:1-acyl-sn-glycerol-3-phosphate acyltransferase